MVSHHELTFESLTIPPTIVRMPRVTIESDVTARLSLSGFHSAHLS